MVDGQVCYRHSKRVELLDLGFAYLLEEVQFLKFIFMKDYMNGTTSNVQILSSNEADRLLYWN